ncbi:nucleotidyltransferase family protein [Butyrivibrio sp. XPD2006]|uniref:nucleotidyltransferase family protein n=1 Tax=Butyrivibrio sp. XPD2006 TaxID=1280668 RepID=UPI0003B6FB10|nr:nucleotidyltransferase family protein [Butyrivibrio sp. XPD2006]
MPDNYEQLIYGFIYLQKASLNGTIPEFSYVGIDWNLFIDLSIRNKCGVLFNNAISKNPQFYGIPNEILDRWNRRSKNEFMISYKMYYEFVRVMKAIDKNNVRAIVLKGYALAVLYTGIFQRYSSDLDLKFENQDREIVHSLLTGELEFVFDEANSKDNVSIYYSKWLKIEAHFTLWEDYQGENTEVLKSEKLDDPTTLTKVKITDDLSITTLGVTEHLILQMFHIIKHYIVEGIESRYFCDIALFVNRYIDDIDFNRFYQVFKKMNFEDFCLVYFSECIKYFDMDKRALQGRNMKSPEDELSFFRDIIFLGKRDLSDRAEYSLLGILSPYVNGGKITEDSKGKRALQALFPSAKNIDQKYSYCKKYPVLLPVAWGHRAIRTVFFKITKGGKVYGAKKKLQESEYRIQMMKNSKLI